MVKTRILFSDLKECIYTLINYRWLFLFPLSFLLLHHVIAIILHFIGLGWSFEIIHNHFDFSLIQDLYYYLPIVLSDTVDSLNYGYFICFSGYPVFTLTLLSIVGFWAFRQKLKKENIENSVFFNKHLLISFSIMVFTLIIILVGFLSGQNLIITNSVYMLFAIYFLVLFLILSLIEGIFLTGVIKIIGGDNYKISSLMSEAMVDLKSLYIFNLILGFFGLLKGSESLMTSMRLIPEFIIGAIKNIGYIVTWILDLTTVAIPIIIVANHCSLKKAINLNFLLLKNKLFIYMELILIGLFFLFFPNFLEQSWDYIVSGNSFLYPIGIMFIDLLKLFPSLVFILALIKLVKINQQTMMNN